MPRTVWRHHLAARPAACRAEARLGGAAVAYNYNQARPDARRPVAGGPVCRQALHLCTVRVGHMYGTAAQIRMLPV